MSEIDSIRTKTQTTINTQTNRHTDTCQYRYTPSAWTLQATIWAWHDILATVLAKSIAAPLSSKSNVTASCLFWHAIKSGVHPSYEWDREHTKTQTTISTYIDNRHTDTCQYRYTPSAWILQTTIWARYDILTTLSAKSIAAPLSSKSNATASCPFSHAM